MIRLLVTTIGSSSGCSTAQRDCAGVYIKGSKNVLLDCGEATNKYFLDRDVNEIDVICLTHAHIDHFIGFPMLLFHNLAIRNRTKPLTIIAPQSIAPFLDPFIDKYHIEYKFDIDFQYYTRRDAMHTVWLFDKVSISAREVKHSMPNCYGYYVTDASEHKCVFYTGDTEPFDKLSMYYQNVDLIIAEGTWASNYNGPRYGHSWVKEMISAADSSGSSKIILTHLSKQYHDETVYRQYSADVMDAFMGCKNLKRIYIAYDGLTISI